MKKRFALYGMFAAMAIFAAACGDDSSSSASAPEEEEYSSSVDDEESSSSEEAVSSSSAKKDGKPSSSEAKKDGKSSSSEKAKSSSSAKDDKSSSSEKAKSSSSAKDDKSSSSEKAKSSSSEPESSSSEPESSSSEPESSSSIPYGYTCSAEKDGNVVSMEAFVKTLDDKVAFTKLVIDYDNMKESEIAPLSVLSLKSCEQARGIDAFSVIECSDETGIVEIETDLTSEDLYPEIATPADAEKNMCSGFGTQFIVNTNSLNKKMLDNGEYGEFRDLRDVNLYRTIKVGDLVWMAQNLDYESESGSSCYGDETGYCVNYGRLYTWEAAQTACPDGWRLPTTTEWDDLLTKTMGAESGTFDLGLTVTEYTTDGVSLLGGDSHTNTYGLSFILGGAYGDPGTETLEYKALHASGVYWLDGGNGKVSIAMVSNFEKDVEEVKMIHDLGDSQMQFSVRCVKK